MSFDNFMFIDEYLRQNKIEIKLKHRLNISSISSRREEIKKNVERLVEEASIKGIGLLPNPEIWTGIYGYCFEKYEEDNSFIFTKEQFNIDSS